ncbi:hypothetical protein LTR37_009397 [Vermiconidia calcicola]|uniref:Uncharacterized protein n=1 Tax=Vermiconidia calcicola TaxID=1690605 RepID=A0ACC3N9P4_9PEZI|nr:hypothetical protein LTR37_009397 [Vermiconidia calcicola]
MATSIFHEGDLNSGIARAIQEKKVVACFIHKPDEHESEIWEDYWLQNKSQPTDMISSDIPPLGLMLAEKAVLLKLELGSREAGFLNAFCPVTKAPTMVVVHNGKVLERLEVGIGKEEFVGRLLRAVGFKSAPAGTSQPEGPPGDEDEEEARDDIGGQNAVPGSEASVPAAEQTNAGPSQPASSGSTSQPPDHVQTMLTERGQRLEAERVKREAAAKAEKIARANARRKETEEASAGHSGDRARGTSDQKDKQQARDAWIYQQKQRKDEAKKERERILGQIESDKQERKAQAARRKELESAAGGGAYSEVPESSTRTTTLPARSVHTSCALQVRLFDGSSIRAKFEPDADIATAVRTWVDEASPEGGADIPYTFRQILAPQPSKTIEMSEEHQSLQELGLIPSATLVLVPVAGATSAYSSAGGGYLNWATSTAYSLLDGIWSYMPTVTAGGRGGPYMGGTGDEHEGSNLEGARMADSDSASPGGAASGNVTGFAASQRKKDDRVTEFYNGNSSAFEGRKDDEEDGK